MGNQSGMRRTAEAICIAEKALGIDSILLLDSPTSPEEVDIHVVHTHVPDAVLHSGKPLVWFAHGTPEVMFNKGYEEGLVSGVYGHGDSWMMAQFWLQRADAIVTFWPRHQRIWKSLCDKRTIVDCIPMGIDLSFWHPVESSGKFAGQPAVFSAENCYTMKWPLDLLIAWPWVVEHPKLHSARLHVIYLPNDQHRWFFPLANRNGSSYHAYLSSAVFGNERLRNTLCSVDYVIGLVRYGDFNRLSLEAAACGAKIISYSGNPYADYWVNEGDQRSMATQLMAILTGAMDPVIGKQKPVDIAETALAMKAIYERIA